MLLFLRHRKPPTTGMSQPRLGGKVASIQASGEAGLHQPEPPEVIEAFLEQRVREMYPDMLSTFYFVPSVFMHKTHHNITRLSEQQVAVPETPKSTQPAKAGSSLLASDVRDDEAHQHIVHCLQELAGVRQEVMFVLSHLQFRDYLGEPYYASAVAHLPKPSDLRQEKRHRGDFDMLIIHRHFGIVVGEVKSVGLNVDADVDKAIIKRIGTAIMQLNKAEDVLRYVVSDKSPAPAVKKVLMMPNVTRATLQRALRTYPLAMTTLCDTLRLPPNADPTDVCLCADSLSDRVTPWRICHDVMRRLQRWWELLLPDNDPAMTDDLYINLVGRFCGPATMVKVFCPSPSRMALPTLQHGVSETGERFARVVLHPKQVNVLQEAPKCLYLSGPPGTGKTLMLVLRACGWLLEGQKVHVLSLMLESLAATYNIEQQLSKMNPGSSSRVHAHYCQVKKLPTDQEQDAAIHTLVESLATMTTDEKLCIIMDEVHWNDVTRDLCERLHARVRHLCLWSAGMHHNYNVPTWMADMKLSEPLRCPPAITREVQGALAYHRNIITAYSATPTPLPCDGPPVIRLSVHSSQDHGDASRLLDCQKCGRQLAHMLKAVKAENSTAKAHQTSRTASKQCNKKKPSVTTTPPPLQWKDVFILVTDDPLEAYRQGVKGLVDGLRQEHVPVRLIDAGDTSGIQEVAKMDGDDSAIVIRYDLVRGLERKVVACVAEATNHRMLQLHGISRATAQAVWVLPRETDTQDKQIRREELRQDQGVIDITFEMTAL